jgi:hypothetical protein
VEPNASADAKNKLSLLQEAALHGPELPASWMDQSHTQAEDERSAKDRKSKKKMAKMNSMKPLEQPWPMPSP